MNVADITSKLEQFKPVSAFLYGSRARTDFNHGSDYEVGVIFRSAEYVSRTEIAQQISLPNVNLYPCRLEDLQAGKIDTPFQAQIFLRELASGARTIYGDKIVEGLVPPHITPLNLLQEVRFDLGRAMAALISQRHGDHASATDGFSKSCLHGARCLVILELRKFPTTYVEILKLADRVVGDEKYRSLVRAAYDLRQKKIEITHQHHFDNLAFLSRAVEPALLDAYRRQDEKPFI